MRIFARVQTAPFELVISLLLITSGFRFLLNRAELHASQIGQTLPVPELWAVGYLAAGVLMFLGVILGLAKVEALGLALMAAFVSINAVAFAYTYDVSETWGAGVALFFYATLALAAIARLTVLMGGLVLIRDGRSGG